MRLRAVVEGDFRCSIDTLLRRALRSKKYKYLVSGINQLKADDVILFVSLKGNQLAFAWGITTLGISRGGKRVEVTRHERLRLSVGTWDVRRIVEYAESVGIQIAGLKRYTDYYRELAA